MKIQALLPAGQESIQHAIAQEDEEWTRSRYWLEGAAGAGFELLKSQSITDDQIEKTKRWLKANRDVVTLKVLSCTIHPKCLIYLPPNLQVT